MTLHFDKLVSRPHCGWVVRLYERCSTHYLTMMVCNDCREPGHDTICRSRTGMVFGKSGTVGFVTKIKTNVCVSPCVSYGVVLTRGLMATCREMSDCKLLPFPSSVQSWLTSLVESVLTVVIWGGGGGKRGGCILSCKYVHVSGCSVPDRKTRLKLKLKLSYALKKIFPGDLLCAWLSLGGHAHFKLPCTMSLHHLPRH